MFQKLGRFKAVLVAAVLIALLTAVGGLVISQAAGGGSGIQALVYNDVVRFAVQNEKVAVLRAEVFNLSGKRLYDSGPVQGKALDWNMSTEAGEQVAHGVYLYVITAWDSQGELVKSQVGKLALVPGGVGLGAAPALVSGSEGNEPVTTGAKDKSVRALAVNQDHHTESWAFKQVGIGTMSPGAELHVKAASGNADLLLENAGGTSKWDISADASGFSWYDALNAKTPFKIETGAPSGAMRIKASGNVGIGTISPGVKLDVAGGDIQVENNQAYRGKTSTGTSGRIFLGTAINDVQIGDVDQVFSGLMRLRGTASGLLLYVGTSPRLSIDSSGKVGIGTTSPGATLEVHGSATNLLALYDPADPSDPKFRVEKTGNVRADGAYYGAGYYTGSADVAERINTSEWVEKGNVVEIDPEHPGFFRKTRSPYSTSVAGVVSSSPGVVLGNNFDAQADKWEDNRPMLALAGRVPVKASTENGPIQVGDLLVSSSQPGYAMKCSDRAACVGAVIGKALEPLEEGNGTIMVQVTLR